MGLHHIPTAQHVNTWITIPLGSGSGLTGRSVNPSFSGSQSHRFLPLGPRWKWSLLHTRYQRWRVMATHYSYIWCHQEPTRSVGMRQGIHDATSQRMCCDKWTVLWISYVILKRVPAHERKLISGKLFNLGPMLIGNFCLIGGGEYPEKVSDVGFETTCICKLSLHYRN
jgi:hypothetical protein